MGTPHTDDSASKRVAANSKVAKAESLLVQLSQNQFCLPENVRTDASRIFEETKQHLSSSLGALGTGNEEDTIKCWIASILYCAFKLSSSSQQIGSRGFTLTKLLGAVKTQVMDFFRELAFFLGKADSVLKFVYGDACSAFQQQLRQVQANYVHLAVLYDNYEKNYSRFFLSYENERLTGDKSSPHMIRGPDESIYLKFGWMLFLALRMHVPGDFVDLMTCANGLISIFVIMIVHMPPQLRKVSLDDTSTFAVRSARGVNIISSLCQLYDASENDVKSMLSKVNSMIQSFMEPKTFVDQNESTQTAGIDTEGLMYFKSLMEKPTVLSYLKVLDTSYVEIYSKQGEIDERSFLPQHTLISDSPSTLSNGLDVSVCGKRKYEVMSSPSRPVALKVNVLSDIAVLTSPSKVSCNKMPPPTPVSVSMATAKWLRSVIVPLPAEPSPKLLSYFRSCDTNITKDVANRAQLLLECVFNLEAVRSSSTGEKPVSSLSCTWAIQRRLEALKLYYRVLGAMCKAEAERLQSNNLSALLTNERFHRCMLACSAEVVLATHKTVTMAFPAVLEPMGITAFDLSKVIESFVRHEDTLPRELKRHLNSIEERLLEMLAWEKGSSMYNSLIIARPHLKSEIHRLGLLAEPLPSLEVLKGRYQLSNENFTKSTTKTFGDTPPVTVLGIPGRDVDAANGSILLSPVRDRSSAFLPFTPTKSIVQPPLQSAFASPQRPLSAGGSETCAETVINIFFQKVLKLSAIRIKPLCEILNHPNDLMEDVYKLIQHLLHHETRLFFKRHIDQIILCSLYGVCKVKLSKLTFKEIVQKYRQLPQHKTHVFRTVLLETRNGSQETGDIIQFYNAVFIPSAKDFLIELSSRLIPTTDNGDKHKGASPFKSLPDASPKKVSANHNVYVSPLKASKVLSPHSRRLYACFGESTHAYQSPSKDLTEINKRLNHRKVGKLDFGNVGLVNDSVVAKDLVSQDWASRQ